MHHLNFKKKYSKGRKKLQVIEIALHELSKLGKLVDVDKFITTKSSDEVYKWAYELASDRKIKIWVIDRRDISSSNAVADVPDKLKVRECEIWAVGLPLDDVVTLE